MNRRACECQSTTAPRAPRPRRDPAAVFFVAVALTMTLTQSTPALAATYRLDDSATLPNESAATMRWKSLAPSRTEGNAVEGAIVVTIRLNTAPWQNRNGRIYLVLPEQQQVGPVTAEWTTQGRLLAGKLISGNRTAVFAGTIGTSSIEDTITLRVQADGRRLASTQRLQFHFEIDVE